MNAYTSVAALQHCCQCLPLPPRRLQHCCSAAAVAERGACGCETAAGGGAAPGRNANSAPQLPAKSPHNCMKSAQNHAARCRARISYPFLARNHAK